MNIQIDDIPYGVYGYDTDIHYFNKNGHRFYKVDIYLTGMDLPFVNKVTYFLHSTFKKRKVTVERTEYNPACKLTLWVWGKFRLAATVEDSKGVKNTFFHYMQFDNHFKDKDIKFIKEVR